MKNTGYIEIIIEEGETPMIEAQLFNNTLWMKKYEMMHFFNVFGQKIEMNIRSIFKSGLLKERDVTYSHHYIEKGVEIEAIYYNLEVLIFLSYRIGTQEAKIFRQFLNSALREHLQRKEHEKCSKLIWFFQKNQSNYWMN
jgi:hypothetical protein